MSAPGIKFYPSRDIHLIRGQSIQLINEANNFASLFFLDDESAVGYINSHPKMEYSFSYSFDKAKAAALGIEIEDIDPLTRHPDVKITLLPNEPADQKNQIRNFYVIAEVRDKDLPVNDKKYKKRALLRIHVHKSIREFWVSPGSINIYKGGGATFSPRVLFDDGCVAELNLSADRRYHILPSIDITYTPSSPDMIADALVNGKIYAAGTPPLLSDVDVVLKFGALELKDKALILYAEKLFRPETNRARLVSGSGSPGAKVLNEVPNVLFISDGFLRTQKDDFTRYVESYVQDLMRNNITAPFKWLKGKINFWMLFIPSFYSGISTYAEFVVKEDQDKNDQPFLTGIPVPFAIAPDDDNVIGWSLENLIYKVGLPGVNEATIPDNELKIKWKETTLLSNLQIAALFIRNKLIKKWKQLAHRKLPDLKNTAMSVTIDHYTSATEDGNENLIDFDDKRFERFYLDTLFNDLKDFEGNIVGTTFLYNERTRGKDFDNIIVLSGAKYGRAVNGDGYMFTTLGNSDVYHLTGTLTDHKINIKDTVLPEKLPIRSKKTMTHELCHSFGLGDEYGELLADDQRKAANEVASQFAVAPDDITLDQYTNLQSLRDLEVKVTDTPNKQIQSYRIKWRYHRIQECGEVSNILKSGNVLTLTLKDDHINHFSSQKKLFIRKRQATNKNYFIIDKVTKEVLASILEPMPLGTRNLTSTIFAIRAGKTEVTLDPIDQYKFKVVPILPDKIVVGKTVVIEKKITTGSIYSIFRKDETTIPPTFEKSLSPPLTIQSINIAAKTILIDLTGITLLADLTFMSGDDRVLAYHPMPVDHDPVAHDYPYYELISQKILNNLLSHPHPYNTNVLNKEIIDNEDISHLSSLLVPCCSRHKKQVIGLYSGGSRYHSGVYHPAARCMMRKGEEGGKYVELCAVCRYTLMNLINPLNYKEFDDDYMNSKVYP